ncbi:MAG: ABC1 kinase family protein [Armatimonadota bacterium]
MARLFLSRREWARAWQIINIVRRYGLLSLAQAHGLGHLFGWSALRMDRRLRDMPAPARLRLALIELGTTFIKLGQMLSARSDLLPPEYLDELSKLQDEVPSLPFEQMLPVFQEEMGGHPDAIFPFFDPQPIASASIGQVYHAHLADGSEVTVKIQRPHVREAIRLDLSLMRRMAGIADKNPFLRRFDFPSLVREFGYVLQDELLYTLEAYNADALAGEMAEYPNIALPTIYWDYTTQRVLTTSLIRGVKINDLEGLDRLGVNRRELANTLANSLLAQILRYGLFHGDPHPGNLLVTPDGVLYFLDTGMVGRLDRKMRELLIELTASIFDQDIDAVLAHLQQLGVVEELTSLPDLRRDLSRLITRYYFLPRKELRLGELLRRINNLLFHHDVRMAYEFGLLAKALFLTEGIAQLLDRDFDYNEAARPLIADIRRDYYSPTTLIDDTVRELRGLQRQIIDLPRRLSAVLDHLERGTLRVRFSDDLWGIKQGVENALLNRLSFALLIIGLLVASAVILSAHPGGWLRAVALAGLVIDSVFIIILLVAIARTGKL